MEPSSGVTHGAGLRLPFRGGVVADKASTKSGGDAVTATKAAAAAGILRVRREFLALGLMAPFFAKYLDTVGGELILPLR